MCPLLLLHSKLPYLSPRWWRGLPGGLPPSTYIPSLSFIFHTAASVTLLTHEPFHITLLWELLVTFGIKYKDLTMTFRAAVNLTLALSPSTSYLLYCSFFFSHIPRIFDLFVNLQTHFVHPFSTPLSSCFSLSKAAPTTTHPSLSWLNLSPHSSLCSNVIY